MKTTIFVVAYKGEAGLLSQTLDQLAIKYSPQPIRCLLVGVDDGLCQIATQAEVDYDTVAEIPANRYWITLLNYTKDIENLIVVRAGCQLPHAFDVRLSFLASQSQAVALSPLLSSGPYFSAFMPKKHKPGLSVSNIDQWLSVFSKGKLIDVPELATSCTFLRCKPFQEALNNTLAADTELLQTLMDNGHAFLLSDSLYVDDSLVPDRAKSVTFEHTLGKALVTRHPLGALRHGLTELSERAELPDEAELPLAVQLHIAHSWGGGLGRWVEDYIEADKTHHNLVLRSIGVRGEFGQSLALYATAAMDVPLEIYPLSRPVLSIDANNFIYQQALTEILKKYRVSSIIVSSLIGHSLQVLTTTLPTTYIFHDFYPFCPAIVATFSSPCASCSLDRLGECRKNNPYHSFFKDEPDAHWLAIREQFINAIKRPEVLAVAPTPSVVTRWVQLAPPLAEKPINVIGHGLAEGLIDQLAQVRSLPAQNDTVLRVVVLGSMSAHKGADIIKSVLLDLAEFCHIWLLGSGEDGAFFRNKKNVTVIPYFERDQLAQHLTEIAPDVGLLLSLVPETFSYTLSELYAAAVPVIATQVGAFNDRVDENSGWLIEPTGEALLAQLRALHANRGNLGEVKKALLNQEPEQASLMVQTYAKAQRMHSEALGFLPDLLRRSQLMPAVKTSEPGRRLHIDHQAPFRVVCAEFFSYAADKIQATSRWPKFIKRPIASLLRILSRRF